MAEDDRDTSNEQWVEEIRRLKVENATLRARNALLEGVIGLSSDALFVKDARGRYLWTNDAGARLIGRPVEEVVGKGDLELFKSETARRMLQADGKVLAGRETRAIEQVETSSGGTRWYMTTRGPYRDHLGHVVGVIGRACDITESKALQAERDQLLDRLRLQIDRLPLAYILMDADFRIIDWNPAAEKLFGYTKEQAAGRSCLDLIVPSPVVEGLQEVLLRLRAGDMHAHGVNENRAGDGRTIACEWFNTPLRDAEGRFTGVISLAQDITERMRAEESLARDTLLLANVRDSIIVTDLEGVVTYWNEGATRLFGWRADEMLGRPLVERVPEEARARMAAVTRDILEGNDFDGEWEDYRSDGTRVWIQARVTRITDAIGRPIGLMGVAHDISDRKRAEEALRESAERLQFLSRRVVEVQEEERRHLARELHDEIGQSLTAIGINLQSLKRSSGATMPLRLEECIAVVDHAIQQVRHLSLDLRPSMLDDLGLVSALRWYLDRQAQRVGYRARFEAEPDEIRLGPEVATAAFRVVQEALTNVARHAHARRLRVRLRLRGGVLRLVVRDDGVGFDPATVPRRGSADRGLGLLGMRERAALLGGRVAIRSAPGRGTAVRLSVPENAALEGD